MIEVHATVANGGWLIEPGFLLGLMLLAACIGSVAARLLHVPRVVGYLSAGIALKWLVAFLASRSMALDRHSAAEMAGAAAAPLSGLTDLALGLILFSIGAVFEAAHIRSIGPRAIRIGLLEMGLTLVLVAIGVGLTGWLAEGWVARDVVALGWFLGVAAIATAPAATLLVLREYDAKGPMTDMVLTLTGINNVISIVLFHVSFLVLAWWGVIDTRADPGRWVWADLFLTTVGSAALGLILGVALCWFYSHNSMAQTFLVFLATLLALGAGQDWLNRHLHLSFSFMLTSITIGAVFGNVAINPERFNASLNTLTMPLFAAFFVLAGYNLHLEDLPRLGWIGCAYVACRIVGKVLGVYWGTRWTALRSTIKPLAGAALLCQAGVVIGLAKFIQDNWGAEANGGFIPAEMATVFFTLILGAVALFELAGPLLIKRVVVSGGEVKAVQLWSQAASAQPGGVSVTTLLLESMGKLFGVKRGPRDKARDDLLVRHVMRTNIKLLHEADSFRDVMHFVERSQFHHFPVADDEDRLIGVIHFADLRDISYEPVLRDLVTAGDLADGDSPCAAVDDTVADVLKEFSRTDLGVLPVVDGRETRKIVGLVEQRDVLRYAGPSANAPGAE